MSNNKLKNIRCFECHRLLFLGDPGLDLYGKPKIIEIKCPRCNRINLINIEIVENIKIKLKGD